jgi:hypothetical protein
VISDDELLMAIVMGGAPIEYPGSLLNKQRNKGNKVRLNDMHEVIEYAKIGKLHGSRFTIEAE